MYEYISNTGMVSNNSTKWANGLHSMFAHSSLVQILGYEKINYMQKRKHKWTYFLSEMNTCWYSTHEQNYCTNFLRGIIAKNNF